MFLKEVAIQLFAGAILALFFFGPLFLFFWALAGGILWGKLVALAIYLALMAVGLWLRQAELALMGPI